MNLDEIKRVVDELDKAIPKENAKVTIQKYGGDLDEAFMVATERGYLRLGVEFLKGGLTPYLSAEKTQGKRPYEIDVELEYLFAEDSDVHFDYFERTEDIRIDRHRASWADRIIPIAVMVVILTILGLAIVGVVAIKKMLF